MRSVRPAGKYRSIRHTKISEIQTGIFGRMERANKLTFAPFLLALTCCPRIAREASSEELGTMSKNNLRRITFVRRGYMGDSLSYLDNLLIKAIYLST